MIRLGRVSWESKKEESVRRRERYWIVKVIIKKKTSCPGYSIEITVCLSTNKISKNQIPHSTTQHTPNHYVLPLTSAVITTSRTVQYFLNHIQYTNYHIYSKAPSLHYHVQYSTVQYLPSASVGDTYPAILAQSGLPAPRLLPTRVEAATWKLI
jgi:hypothetical protein